MNNNLQLRGKNVFGSIREIKLNENGKGDGEIVVWKIKHAQRYFFVCKFLLLG